MIHYISQYYQIIKYTNEQYNTIVQF